MNSENKIVIQLQADIQDVNKKLEDVQKNVQKIESSNASVASFAKLGVAIGAVSIASKKLLTVAKDLVSNYKVQEQNLTKLNAVNNAVGQSIGKTTEELANMASELQKNSTFGDEMILNAQQTLLAVGNLSKEGFERAVQASADLASAMGTDITSASQSLSMALLDPEQGLRRLRTQGIMFTDEEKEQIKVLMDNGKQQEAQAKILEKVESKYKGIAKAVADTDTGKLTQIANVWSDIKEDLGGALADMISPVLEDMLKKLQDIQGFINQYRQSGQMFSAFVNGKPEKLGLFDSSALIKERDRLKEFIDYWDKIDVGHVTADQRAYLEALNKAVDKAVEQTKWENMGKHYASQVIPQGNTGNKYGLDEAGLSSFLNKHAIADARAELEKAKKTAYDFQKALIIDKKSSALDTEEYKTLTAIIEDCNKQLYEMSDEFELLNEYGSLSETLEADKLAEDLERVALAIENCTDPKTLEYLKEIQKGLQETEKDIDGVAEFLNKTLENSEITVEQWIQKIGSAISQLFDGINTIVQNSYQARIDAMQAEYEAHKEVGDLTQEEEKEMARNIQNEKRKAFEADKKNSISQALINGALAITSIWAGSEPWYVKLALSAMSASITGVQVGAISSQQFTGYERGGIVGGSGITGDNHLIMANAGELILTKAQQGAIASQLQGGGSSVVEINFNGQVFGDQRTISEYVYDGIKTAQMQGDLRKW